MSVGRLTYLDLTPGQRTEAAKAARQRVRTAMANPLLTPDQQVALQAHLRLIDNWESGRIPVSAHPEQKSFTGVEHTVELTETVSVDEKL